jgi:uncharacterized protein YbaR (Trm112 family)
MNEKKPHFSILCCPNCGKDLSVEVKEEADEEHNVEKAVKGAAPSVRNAILKAAGEDLEDD